MVKIECRKNSGYLNFLAVVHHLGGSFQLYNVEVHQHSLGNLPRQGLTL